MGLIDWFNGLFAESPPEQLVLGAELRCPYGSEHSYLYIETDHIDIDNLPEACVEDCIAGENINPFGECFGGRNCKDKMELAGQWENPEPQTMVVNGKEIITTKSTLLCKAEGMLIEAVTSGQDKIVAERIALFLEVEEKYPGLLAILTDPYGSLYLQEGMYETALRFIEDRMECNGGEIWIPGLFNKEDLEGELVRAALERLLTDCDASSVNRFLEGLETTGVQYGMYDEVEGWETVTLNDKMMDMLKEDCKATAERIKTSSFARWVEENKRFVDLMADGATQLAYATVIYSSTLKQPIKEMGEDSLDKIKDETNNKVGNDDTSTLGYSDFADGMSPEDAARYIANNEKAFFNEFSERACAAGLDNTQIAEAFEAMRTGDYAKMSSYFDTSSPVDGAVFWSGSKGGAAAYANNIGGTIMEQTPGGQVFDNWRGLGGMYPEWDTATNLAQKPIWDALSSQYANEAEGIATYVHPDGYVGNVWMNIEKPILEENNIIIQEVIIGAK